ncbi:MAG: HAD family hydrolase [Chitinophagaceae bacterium]|nr:HAD family hydrolase [Chitinophagaceae bacterium]
MNLADVKLIATDMDGTLLNSKKELNPVFFNIFDKLKAKRVLFAAASGRQFYNLQNELSAVKNDVIFIAENGSYIVYKNKDLLVQALDKEVVHSLVHIARNIPDTYIILCGKQQAYIEKTDARFMEHVNMYYDRQKVVSDLLEVEHDQFLKIAICDFRGSEQNSYTWFKHLENELQVKVSGTLWLDLSHRLANKGRAIKVLQQEFNINYNETMVFGDYLNDLEMMKEGYFSYAMENAHPEIKETARFVTASNDDDGVLKVLGELLDTMS